MIKFDSVLQFCVILILLFEVTFRIDNLHLLKRLTEADDEEIENYGKRYKIFIGKIVHDLRNPLSALQGLMRYFSKDVVPKLPVKRLEEEEEEVEGEEEEEEEEEEKGPRITIHYGRRMEGKKKNCENSHEFERAGKTPLRKRVHRMNNHKRGLKISSRNGRLSVSYPNQPKSQYGNGDRLLTVEKGILPKRHSDTLLRHRRVDRIITDERRILRRSSSSPNLSITSVSPLPTDRTPSTTLSVTSDATGYTLSSSSSRSSSRSSSTTSALTKQKSRHLQREVRRGSVSMDDCCQLIDDACTEMDHHLRLLLETFKLKAGKIKPELKSVDPLAFLTGLVEERLFQEHRKREQMLVNNHKPMRKSSFGGMRRRTYYRRNCLKYIPCSELPGRIMVDPVLLQTVIKIMVCHSLRSTASGTVEIRVDYHKDHLLFCLGDTGVGMKDEDIYGIYKDDEIRFGLSVAMKMASSMGGKLLIRGQSYEEVKRKKREEEARKKRKKTKWENFWNGVATFLQIKHSETYNMVRKFNTPSYDGFFSPYSFTTVMCLKVPAPKPSYTHKMDDFRRNSDFGQFGNSHQLEILCVDDCFFIRNFLQKIIGDVMNYEFDMTDEGISAVDMLARKEYDVVLLDFNLKDIKGSEVIRLARLRGVLDKEKTKVVMMSGNDVSEESYKGMGFDMKLTKPIKIEQVAEIFEKVFEWRCSKEY